MGAQQTSGDVGFDVFWAAYPRHDAKLPALKEWRKLKPDAELQAKILESLTWQKETRQWREGFIPHGRTFLSQRRFEDEPFHPAPLVPRNGHGKAEALLRTLGVKSQ